MVVMMGSWGSRGGKGEIGILTTKCRCQYSSTRITAVVIVGEREVEGGIGVDDCATTYRKISREINHRFNQCSVSVNSDGRPTALQRLIMSVG